MKCLIGRCLFNCSRLLEHAQTVPVLTVQCSVLPETLSGHPYANTYRYFSKNFYFSTMPNQFSFVHHIVVNRCVPTVFMCWRVAIFHCQEAIFNFKFLMHFAFSNYIQKCCPPDKGKGFQAFRKN